mgnify:FL=1
MINLTVSHVIVFIATVFLVFIAHRILVFPQLLLAQYRKHKHIKTLIRSRIAPSMKSFFRDAETKGDFFYSAKQLIEEDPDCKAIVSVNGPLLSVQLTDPDLLKEFFKLQQQHPDLYEKKFGGGLLKMFLKDGLFSAEGNIWKKHRKIDSQAFHFEFVRSQVNVIRKISKDFINKIDFNDKLSAIDFFQNITGEIVCRAFFGSGLSSQKYNGKSFCQIVAELTSDIVVEAMTPMHIMFNKYYVKYFPSKKVKDVLRRMEEFKQVCRNIVTERKNQMKKGEFPPEAEHDLLYLLLKYQQENPHENFDDDEIVHEFITFFIAGLDTTGHLLGMATYYISRTPGVKEKLREEIESVFGANRNEEVTITYEDLNKLEYMVSVFNETLRLATPAPILAPREARKTHKLGELLIHKGTVLIPVFILNHTNAKYFDDPTEFRPDRWRNSAGKVMSSHPQNPFIFTPFSTGSRNCIGQHMAMLEAKIILSEFMRVIDFEVPEDYTLKMTRRFLYEPVDELKLHIRKI